jgi:hypothetical protein
MAASLRIPPVDRWKLARVDNLLELGKAQALQFDWWTAFRHGTQSLDCFAARLKAGPLQ